jgi:cardiolipin synthase
MCLGLLAFWGCSNSPEFTRPLPPVASVHSPAFREGTGAAVGGSFVNGNRITTLNNGNEIFPAMLAAISSARTTVNMEMFVFEKGLIPQRFADALADRARAGVQVRVLLDAVGAAKSRGYHADLRAAGVVLELHHRVWWPDLRRYNHRTHRKLLIVDGRVGFIGGVGIADHWAGAAGSPEEWRDIHYRVEGPVVAQLQGAFQDNWVQAHGEILQGPAHFPASATAGTTAASVFYSSPRRQRYGSELMYHLALASAEKSIRITNPYFLPRRELSDALCAAARRGVKVQILLPGEYIDQKAVRRGSRKRWPTLLAAGIEIYEYQPTMIHTKLLVIDDYFVSLGSTNLDPRSLRLNDEANMNVLDRTFARQQANIFANDLLRAKRISGKSDAGRVAELPAQSLQTPIESQL